MERVSRNQLLVAGGVALLVLVGLNVVTAVQARKLPPQQLLQRIANTAGPMKDIFVGDSQMQDDVDAVVFSESCRGAEAINVALGATKASEHCLLFEAVLQHAPVAETLFYGFYDDLLTMPVPANWSDLGGNRALSFIFAKRAGELLFPDDASARLRLRVLASIPMYAERLGIWARVERARRWLGGIGLPAAAASHFGRAADFAMAEPTDAAAFEARLIAAAREQRPFNHAVEEIFAHAGQRRLHSHLIAMPMPRSHRERFYDTEAWRNYLRHVAARAESHGARFIDAADWVPDGYFVDPLHLGPEGAKIFSRKLADAVCRERESSAGR